MSRYPVAVAVTGLLACAAPAHAQDPGARIINPDGTITVPYQVALARRTLDDDGNVAVFCGGTVRDAAHVITAAHCLEGETTDAPGEFLVVAGLFQRSDPSVAQVVEVAAITTHPAYRGADTGTTSASSRWPNRSSSRLAPFRSIRRGPSARWRWQPQAATRSGRR